MTAPHDVAATDRPVSVGSATTTDAAAREPICPYLTSAGGAWRSVGVSRDHRCGALDPPAALSAETQRALCLSVEHASCQTFRAARAARAAVLAPGAHPGLIAARDAARRPLPRTAPVVLEPPRLIDHAARLPLDRAPGQLALVALMILAFAAVGFARLTAGDGSAGPSPAAGEASPSASASPTPRPTRRATPSPSAVASPSVDPSAAIASPSPVAAATPAPSFRTYTVRANDTLIGIASAYGSTVGAIRELNGLDTAAILRIGQVLKIP